MDSVAELMPPPQGSSSLQIVTGYIQVHIFLKACDFKRGYWFHSLIPWVEAVLWFWFNFFLRKDSKYCKALCEIAGVGKSAAVIIKGCYSLLCEVPEYLYMGGTHQPTEQPLQHPSVGQSRARQCRQPTSLTGSDAKMIFDLIYSS